MPLRQLFQTKGLDELIEVGRSIGMVIERNCRHRPAPSSAADSYSSNGTACILAR